MSVCYDKLWKMLIDKKMNRKNHRKKCKNSTFSYQFEPHKCGMGFIMEFADDGDLQSKIIKMISVK